MEDHPNRAPHFFTETPLRAIPEIPYEKLVELSQLATIADTVSLYDDLRIATKKLAWTKLAGLRALGIDQILSQQEVDSYKLSDPVAQAEHARAITELVTYGKATLDSISHFFNKRWALGFKEKSSDLKWSTFRQGVLEKIPALKEFLTNSTWWLDGKAKESSSLPAARDFWIHRSSPAIRLVWPPIEIGVLPIPKTLTQSLSTHVCSENFYSTHDFASLHLSKLTSLFHTALEAAIAEERQHNPGYVNKTDNETVMEFYPFVLSTSMQIAGIKLGPFSQPS
ncbi:MAG: hypothetical protein J0H09_16625 [Burkholderiales bacterium]|nr:hypothetical protein [Burkholderiales bacterium]